MYEILLVVYLVIAIALIGFILLQKSKGAGMGASFGAGASGTVFGSSGSGNFLTKTTTFLAIGFFAVALALGNMTANNDQSETSNSLFTEEDLKPANETEVPTVDSATEIPVATPETATDSELPTVQEETKEEESEEKDPPSQ